MANKKAFKKSFSVDSLDASKLKNVDAPVVRNLEIVTTPRNGTVEVPRDIMPMVFFHNESIDPKTLTGDNVYLVNSLGGKIPGSVRVSALGDIAIDIVGGLEPNTKYLFNFSNKLRNEKGKKVVIADNSIFFITGK